MSDTPGKPGCQCKQGHRNNPAFHHEACPWAQRMHRLQREREEAVPTPWVQQALRRTPYI